MCAYKVIFLLVLVLFPVTEGHRVHRNVVETSFPGIAFELLLTKLEFLEYKLFEMESVIKNADQKLSSVIKQLNHNFTTLLKQSKKYQESFDKKLNGGEEVITKLVAPARQNLSSIQTKPKKTEQAVNEKHEPLHEIYYQNISFPSCKANPSKRSNKYYIQPVGYDQPFLGYCEQTAFGGGWLVFQHRYDGSVDFYRNWNDYSNGFGSMDGEFWLGLEHLHRLTSARPHELLVELKEFEGNYIYARYSEFEVGSETEQYLLKKLGLYSGTAVHSFSGKNIKFTTKDRDNDYYRGGNCAEKHHGAWWYYSCTNANLNGHYLKEEGEQTINWFYYKRDWRGFAYSRMSIREI